MLARSYSNVELIDTSKSLTWLTLSTFCPEELLLVNFLENIKRRYITVVIVVII